MVKDKYLKELIKTVNNFQPAKEWKIFLFGSGVNKEKFGDLDLGVIDSQVEQKDIMELKEIFYNSSLPYNVDIIDFNTVSNEFKNNVLNNKIIWIKP